MEKEYGNFTKADRTEYKGFIIRAEYSFVGKKKSYAIYTKDYKTSFEETFETLEEAKEYINQINKK